MAEAVTPLSRARDVLRMIAIGIQQHHIQARDVEFLYDDGPKRVSVHRLAVESMRSLDQEIAARAALAELVALKDIKDVLESPATDPWCNAEQIEHARSKMRADYERRKAPAWAAARAALGVTGGGDAG